MTHEQLEALVRSDGELVAGRIVFEHLRVRSRPGWAAEVLSASFGCVDEVPTVVGQVARLGSGPNAGWADGRNAFQAVRRETMRLDEKKYGGLGLMTNQEERIHMILVLAEFVAKVVYNSTQPDDGFDEEAGWNIVPVARDLIGLVSDTGFKRRMLTALVGR